MFKASADGASEKFRVFYTGTANDVIIFKFQGAFAPPAPPGDAHGWGYPHLCVGEEEDGALVLHARLLVQLLQVVVEGRVVVAATQLDLEALAAVDVRRQSATQARHMQA